MFERCRDILVQRFQSERIWLTISTPYGGARTIGPAHGQGSAKEAARLASGETQVTILAEGAAVDQLRGSALPVALGLSVVLELRSVLVERQAALEDAVFQLRALRQVARLLSSVHSSGETEQLILDFMAEVFFTWWACLYRPADGRLTPAVYRSRDNQPAPPRIEADPLTEALPSGSPICRPDDVRLATLFPRDTQLIVPIDAGIERMAVLALGPRLGNRAFGRPEFELAGTLAFAAAIALKNAELVEELHSAATTDELTGLYNRRAVEERLAAELSRGSRHQLHTSVVLIDIDRFKPINDTLGHAAGDALLVHMASILRTQCRTLDAVGRLGGDEFLVVLPMTKTDEAMVFINRVRKQVAAIGETHPEFGRQTVSLGLAESPTHGGTASDLLAAADAALYRAKRSGRDTVSLPETP